EELCEQYPCHGLSKEKDEQVWPPDVEAVFLQAIEKIPKLGRRKIVVNGKPCGRNELISDYIYRKTGKLRTRKQVSSHIQVLKNTRKNDPNFMRLLTESNEQDSLLESFIHDNGATIPSSIGHWPGSYESGYLNLLYTWPIVFQPKLPIPLWPYKIALRLENVDEASYVISQWRYQSPSDICKKDPWSLQLKCPWSDVYKVVSKLPPTCPFLSSLVTLSIPLDLISNDSQFSNSNLFCSKELRTLRCTTSVYSFGACVLESTDTQQANSCIESGYLYGFHFINPFFEAFFKGIRTLSTWDEIYTAIDHLYMMQLFEDACTNEPLLVVMFTFQHGHQGNMDFFAVSV
ncbi:TEA-domain-containing protein, partial [Hesseltinella vesiculosa]